MMKKLLLGLLVITAFTSLLVLPTAARTDDVSAPGKKISFTDVSFQAKVSGDMLAGGHGIGWADIDNDGDLDLYQIDTPSHSFFRNYLYVNSGDGTFREMAKKRGVEGFEDGAHTGIFADMDNDGDYDLVSSNSGLDGGPAQNRLYINDGKGFFTDVTENLNFNGDLFRTRGIAVADLNNDGWMDMVVTNGVADTDEPPAEPLPVPRMYLSNKKGNYIKRSGGLFHTGFTNGIISGDIDGDGDIDLIESKRAPFNYAGITQQLWLNNGKGVFTDASGTIGENFAHDAEGPTGNGAALGDLDNDGDLDLITISSENVRLFRNNGNGSFEEVTDSAGVYGEAYGAAIGDLDNDGDQDFVIANLTGEYNVWENVGDLHFIPHNDAGVSPPYFSDPRGIALADYDDDGDLDISLVHKFNHAQLFRNNNNLKKNFIKLYLMCPNGQIGGMGAKVWVYKAGEDWTTANLLAFREVSANTGYLVENAPEVHVGLARRKQLVDIRIRFLDGTESHFLNIKPGSRIKVKFF